MHYINGQWTQGAGAEFSSENPATGETIWRGKAADSSQVEAAVAAARAAFHGWRTTPIDERIAILTRMRDLLEAGKAELSALISQEVGKAKWDADGEAAATIGKLSACLAAFEERTGSKETELNGLHSRLSHRPHGVMAVYGPYNFPTHIPGGHIMPALLAGNVVVFKPSELTPKTGEWYVRKWEEAGLPAGVLNLVQGERETGMALSAAPINGLLFTGSSRTGALLHKQFGGRPEVILALELGGNNPLIIDAGVDPKAAAFETIMSAYTGSGQRCTCARRLIVVGEQPEYLAALADAIESIIVGAYTDTPAPFMGPVISSAVADQLINAQNRWISLGAKPLTPMRRLHETLPFVSLALIDVTNVDNIEDEEYFGPLLKLYRAANLDEAIAIANDTRFGLSAAILTPSAANGQRALADINAGLININQQTTGASGWNPFGGVGLSGNHHPAGYYAADYCAYPVASMQKPALAIPETLPPGVTI